MISEKDRKKEEMEERRKERKLTTKYLFGK